MNCGKCNRTISGNYIKAIGGAYHADCFCCSVCGEIIGSEKFIVHMNHPVHPKCYSQSFAPRCVGCGDPVTEKTIQALGKYWHPGCFLCAKCGKPIQGKFAEKDGNAFHESCHTSSFAQKCSICNKAMSKKYIKDGWGNKFCIDHTKKMSPCFSCERLISDTLTGGGVKHVDGTSICNICNNTAVIDVEENRDLVRMAYHVLSQSGLELGDISVPIRLVNENYLRKHARSDTDGSLLSLLFGWLRIHKKKNIYGHAMTKTIQQENKVVDIQIVEIGILFGLPRELFCEVLIHELTHVWLALKGYYDLPMQVEEGLCGLSEYLWLRHLLTPEAAYRLKQLQESKHPIYGVGFRRAKSAWSQHGLQPLLKFVRRKKRFPLVWGAGGWVL
ncbi:MAG: protein DA1 [Magnetococcus sp. YQC-5]